MPVKPLVISRTLDTNIAREMISQSRHTTFPYLHITVNAFPPRNRVRDLSFFGYLFGDGRGFFPEGRHALCRHCVDECRSTLATDKCEWLLKIIKISSVDSMMTSLYSEQIPVTEITSDWCKFHFPRNSRVITCVNLNLDFCPNEEMCRKQTSL